MIDELYQDKGTVSRDGEDVPFENSAHLWWVRMVNGTIRPASESEVELWQLAMGYKDNYQGACQNFWDTYCAGTGKTIDTFDGVDGETPWDEVANYRKSLEAKIREMVSVYEAAEQVRSSNRNSYSVEINGVSITKAPTS